MGILRNSYQNLTRNSIANGSSLNSQSTFMTKRAGLKVAGIFIIIGILAVISSNFGSKSAADNNSASTQTKTAKVQVSQSTSGNDVPSSAATSTQNTTNNGLSSNVNSTTTNGHTSTSMTVNGQKVSLPANGNSQQIINTPSGPVNVSATNTQNASGESSNTSITSTTVNTYSSSSTSSQSNLNEMESNY